jgi:hypothetical protein
MTAINNYIKHIQKCKNQCLKYKTCLRYDKNASDDLMENKNCMYYFETKKDDTLEYLKNMFGIK